MSGHVFHPGHHELHGITVVLDAHGGRTYVGRFDSENEAGVHLLNLTLHDPGDSTVSREEFLRKSIKYGVRNDHKHMIVPSKDVARITTLTDVERQLSNS